jgi:hypothetical protein
MVLPLGKTQEIMQARTPVVALEGCEHVSGIYRGEYPESAFAFGFHDVRGTDQVAITEAPVLIFPLVAKHNTYRRAGANKHIA